MPGWLNKNETHIVTHESENNYYTKDAIDGIGHDTHTSASPQGPVEAPVEGDDAGILGDGQEHKEAAHDGILLYL